jgi:hypothetical protein
MTTALDRRLQALESDTQQPEPLSLTLQFVGGGGVVAVWYFPDGQRLERHEGETEAAFLVRVEAAR